MANFRKQWSRATSSGGVRDYDLLYSDHQKALKKTHKYFEEVAPRVRAKVYAAMHVFGQTQVNQAKRRMSLGKHGRLYKISETFSYRASAEGEPPANKFGLLRQNIEYKVYTGHVLTVQLGYFLSNSPPKGFNYGNFLEYERNRPNLRLVTPFMTTYGHKTIQKLIKNAMDLGSYMK